MVQVRIRRQVAPGALPGVRVSTDAPEAAFGGGKAAERLNRESGQLAGQADQLNDVAYREREKEVVSQLRLATAEQEAMLAGEADRLARESQKYRGADAADVSGRLLFDYDAYEQKALGKIKSVEVRQAVKQRSLEKRQHLRGYLLKYEDEEGRAHDLQITKNALTIEDTAVQTDPSEGRIQSALKTKAEVLDALAANPRNGITPEKLQEMKAEAASRTHLLALTQMVGADRTGEASAYFEKHKGNLYGDDVEAAQKLIRAGSAEAEARRITAEVSKEEDETVALAKIEAMGIKDTKVYDAARRRTREEFLIKRQVRKERQEKYFNDAWHWVERRPGHLSMFEPLKESMAPGDWERLEKHAYNLRTGQYVQTNQTRKHELILMASVDPERFKRLNLLRDYGNLDPQDREQMVKLQASVIEKGFDQAAEDYRQTHTMVDGKLAGRGIDTTPSGDKDKAALLENFRSLVNRALRAEEGQIAPRKLTPDDKERIVTRILDESVEAGTWHSGASMKPGFEERVFSSKQVPEEERRKIVDSFKRIKNRVPTGQEIIDAYNKRGAGGAGK